MSPRITFRLTDGSVVSSEVSNLESVVAATEWCESLLTLRLPAVTLSSETGSHVINMREVACMMVTAV